MDRGVTGHATALPNGVDPTMGRSASRRFRPLASVRLAWRRLSPFFRASRAWLALLVVLAVSAGLLEASVLALIAAMAVSLSEGSASTNLSIGPLTVDMPRTTTFVVALALTLARAVLQLALAYLPARMSAQVMADLRTELFDAFTDTSWATKAQERDGAFQTLMTQNVTNVSSAVIGLGSGITATIMFTMMVVVALLQNALAAGVLAVAAIALFAALRPLSRVLRRNAKRLSREAMSFTESVQDVVLVAEETEVFGATPTYVSDFHRRVDAVRRPHARTRFLSGALPALYQSVALVMLVVALIAVALSGATDLAALAAVILLLIRALTYAQQIQTAVTNIDERIPFMDQIADALERYRDHPQQDGSDDLGDVCSLRMVRAGFSYRPGTEVLRDVSFEVRRGEAIGIVGPSGAGKSSIVQLLLRLREPSSGAVLVDERDVRTIRRDQWRRAVAYVPQTSQLVWGTVRDNIRFHRSWIDDDQVERAARRAHIHDDIMSWPDGYDTEIGQRVGAVSGGQRQRICLARALADEPQVLVLDEPTSALDVRSEDAVRSFTARDQGRDHPGAGRPSAHDAVHVRPHRCHGRRTRVRGRVARRPRRTRRVLPGGQLHHPTPAATVTALDDAAVVALEGLGFGAAEVERMERLPQGVKNINYRVRAGGRDWVLKCHVASDAAERLVATHRLESRLDEAGLPVARLHRTRAGDSFVTTDAGVFTLHGWVEGRQVSIAELDAVHSDRPTLARELGRLLGDLHRVGLDALEPPTESVAVDRLLSGPRRTRASIRHGPPRRFRKTARLRRSGHAFDHWVLTNLPDLFRDAGRLASPRAVAVFDTADVVLAHNDVNWENVVLGQDLGVVGLLDFDNAAPLPRALDVGAAAAVLVGADEGRLDRFLAAYELASGASLDRAAVHLAMRWKCVRSILWSVDAYVSGRVADTEMVAVWCRHLGACWSELPPFGTRVPPTAR